MPPAPPRGAVRQFASAGNLFSAAYLFALLAYSAKYLTPTLFRAWFFSSDEYVTVAEIIRFIQLDFRQHFFDNPNSLTMLLDSFLWAVYYGVRHLLGFVPAGAGIADYTFQHIADVFVLLRGTTVFFFLVSIVLMFIFVSRLLNRAAGAVAALLLTMSPVYSSYSSFGKTESAAVALALGALICLTTAIPERESSDPPRLRDRTVLAGILAGLAAGDRLHSIVATMPALIGLLWAYGLPAKSQYPAWIVRWFRGLLPLSWIASVGVFVLAWSRLGALPGAQHFVMRVTMAWLAATVAVFALYAIRASRPFLVRWLSPLVVKVALGSFVGLLLGNPFLVPRYANFLNSVQMYSRYLDWDRVTWPFWKNLTWYLDHYLKVLAPDTIVLILLAVGAVWILASRDRKFLALLAAAILFLVSKPLTLVAAPHHIILWLPFFFAVGGYGAGKAFDILSRRLPRGNLWACAFAAVLLVVMARNLSPGPRIAVENLRPTDERLHSIEQASTWLEHNTDPRAVIEVSYFCFNPGIFYEWLRSMEVPVPGWVLGERQYLIWWGHVRSLTGKSGYACATPSDVDDIKRKLDLSEPGQGTDPYTDPHFNHVASFGSGPSTVDLFHFDYR